MRGLVAIACVGACAEGIENGTIESYGKLPERALEYSAMRTKPTTSTAAAAMASQRSRWRRALIGVRFLQRATPGFGIGINGSGNVGTVSLVNALGVAVEQVSPHITSLDVTTCACA